MPEQLAKQPRDDADFWRSCCERGITVCKIPTPMREEVECWLIQKHETFADRKSWVAAHTFETLEDVYRAVAQYLLTNIEPGLR